MKKLISLSVIVILLLSACSKMPNHAKYVPKNALFVGTIDMNKLNKKLIWNAITGSELFNDMLKDLKNEDSKKAAKDVSNIGLDQNTTVYAYYTGSLKANGNMAVVIAMKDADKFEAFIKKTYPTQTIEDNKDYKNCSIESSMLVAWNKDVAMVFPTMQKKGTDYTGAVTAEDSVEVAMNTVSNGIQLNSTENIKTYLKEAFSLSKENSIVSNDNFAKLQKDNHDISFWMNYEEFMKSNKELTSGPAAAFVKEEYFKDAALAAGFDFEKGQIDGVMDYSMSKELAAIYKKYDNDHVNPDMVKNIPSKDVTMLLTYKINLKMIKEYLEKFKLDGMLNMGLMMAGTSMDKITETFSGDIVFALTDVKEKTTTTPATSSNDLSIDSKVDMNMLVSVGINDVAEAEKLLGKGVQSSAIVKNGNQYTMPGSENSLLVLDKKMAVYSTNKEMVTNYIAGKGGVKEAVSSDVYSNLTNNMMGFYMDINKTAHAFPSAMTGKTEEEKKLMTEAQNMLTYAQLYGGSMKNNASHMQGNLYFTNKDENALIQLLNFAVKMKKLKEMQDAKNTTTATAVDSTGSY